VSTESNKIMLEALKFVVERIESWDSVLFSDYSIVVSKGESDIFGEELLESCAGEFVVCCFKIL
jgi:hypothetical protein